jgi:hypothetical protein
METDNPSLDAASNTFNISGGAAYVGGGHIYVPDAYAKRVLIFDENITDANASAIAVLGQSSFTTKNQGNEAHELDDPYHVTAYKGKLIVTDRDNQRVLIYDDLPTETNSSASIVIGQDDFGEGAFGCERGRFENPEAAFAVNDKFFVVDFQNSRVLIWNSFPTESGALPDLVLGQANFTQCQPNDINGTNEAQLFSGAHTLLYPKYVWSDGNRVIVADGNMRVLIWNSFPTENGAPADIVLGQSDFAHKRQNDDNQDGVAEALPTARVLYRPKSIFVNESQL